MSHIPTRFINLDLHFKAVSVVSSLFNQPIETMAHNYDGRIKEVEDLAVESFNKGIDDACLLLERMTENDTNAVVVYHSRNVASAIRHKLKIK